MLKIACTTCVVAILLLTNIGLGLRSKAFEAIGDGSQGSDLSQRQRMVPSIQVDILQLTQ